MDTLKDVKMRTRSLIGDPDADFATDAYIVPLINQAYDVGTHRLLNTCSPFIEKYVVIPNVAQGVTTLQAFQVTGGLLDGLMNPLEMQFKPAGFPDGDYRWAPEKMRLPNLSPVNAPPLGSLMWTWRAYILGLTPTPWPCDIRVLGEFKPSALQKDSDLIVLHPMMTAALSFATAGLIGSERQNQNYQQTYTPLAEATFDDIGAELVRQEQGTTSRLGRVNRSRPGRGRWGN